MADLGHGQVSADGVVLADLEVAQAQLVLVVLEGAFHRPATEGDVQHRFDGRSGAGVAEDTGLSRLRA